ncbi:MAG: lysylphosphatidylglycerol synthase transmembrane domain-containing protein [Ilumatobacteraceae bacterium]
MLQVAGAVVVVGFVAGLVLGNRAEFPQAWHALRHARPVWIAVMVLATLVALVNVAMFTAAAQRAAGLDTRAVELYEAATVANFLNRVTKSGGLAGLAPISAQARRAGRPLPPVVAAYLLVVLIGQWTFAVVLVVTLAIMWASGDLFAAEIVASLVFAAVVLAQLAAVVAAWRSPATLRRLHAATARLRARLTRRPLRAVDPRAADEFTSALQIIRRSPWRCVAVAGHGFVVEICGVVQLAAAIAAVGGGRRIVPALVVYSVGVLFSIVGFLPAGIGFVEVSSTATLVTFGVNVGAAAACVLLFRVAELWIPVAIGGVLALRRRRTPATHAPPTSPASPAPPATPATPAPPTASGQAP